MYYLKDHRVLYEDRALLTYEEARQFLWYALTRKKRSSGRIQQLFAQLESFGRASHAQAFSSRFARIAGGAPMFLKICVWKKDGGYYITCFGNRAEWALERVNMGPFRYAAKLERRHKKGAARKQKRRKRKSRYRPRGVSQKRTTKQAFLPAPLATKRKEKLVRQFHKHEITWHEAQKLVEVAFQVRRNWKYTAAQLVSSQLFGSLEQSGERFAQFSRRGFCVRFDLVDGIWRNGLTRVEVYCTKDNTSAVYRRLRKELKSVAIASSADKKKERRRKLRRMRRQRILLAVA